MAESNTFKNAGAGPFSDGVATLSAAGLGMLAMVLVFAVDPFGPAVVVLSWLLIWAGIAIAVMPGQRRPIGPGLLFAGAAAPVAVFLWLWVVVSVGMLGGSFSR